MVVENLIFNIKRQGDAAASGVNGLSRAMDRLRSASNNATKHTNKFLSSLKRIAYYRVLRTIIKDISQAFMEGLQNVYQYSKTIDSVISQALDGISGAGLQMKNQLGAALGELIATIQPIIVAIINLITRLADAMSQVFALLGGRSTYHKATESTKDWATAATGAAKAAKEWKNQLMGFDEINRLEEPADRTGGAGGGGADFGNFELADVDIDFGRLQKYIDATKEWLSNLNFDPLIQAWGKLRDAVSDFIDIVDGALYWAYTNVLLPLGKWFIESLAPASVEHLASVFNFLNAVLEKLAPVFLKLWDEILKPFAKFIGEVLIKSIQWSTDAFNGLAEKIKNANSLGEFLKSLNGKETIVLALAIAIGTLGTAFLIFKTVTSIISGFSAVIAAVTSPVGIAIVAITGLVIAGVALYQNWDNIVAGLKDKWNKLKEAAISIFHGIGQSIVESSNEFVSKFVNKISELKTKATNIFENIRTTIANILDKVKGLFNFSWSLPRPKIPHIGWTWDWMTAAGISIPIPNFKLEWYANGGFPEDGLFMANHNELVGQFSNGKTAVANNEQIITGIKQGVIEAMMTVMSYQDNGGNSRNTEFVFNLNGREFARAIYNDTRAVAKEHGGSLINA